ncbi:MAG: hypothetical protein JNM24_17905 [Bdellovibrionaceae bacterium]|nr:hypothetical protein [Pseudobdellovibrionaceae bacterium]
MRKSLFKDLLFAVVVVPKGLQIEYRLKEGLNSEILTPEAISSLKNENNVVEMADKRRAKTSATVADSESADSGLPSDNLEIEKLQVLRIGSERHY